MSLYLVGGGSGICKIIYPQLIQYFPQVKVFSSNRKNQKFYSDSSTFVKTQALSTRKSVEKIATELQQEKSPSLVINFFGDFGRISNLEEINIRDFNRTLTRNLDNFILMNELMKKAPSNSLLISFGGAGIGGDEVDMSSPAYLASKAALMVTVEKMNEELHKFNANSCLISPGPFPTRMQAQVANSISSAISVKQRKNAIETLRNHPESTNVVELIIQLWSNPELAGGRCWSARFDRGMTIDKNSNFGRMRRIIE